MAAPATLVVLQPHLIMRTMTKNNEFMVIHSMLEPMLARLRNQRLGWHW